MTRKTVNARIEELRKLKGLSQTDFALALGMDEKKGRSTVNNWEQGVVQVKSDDLIRIAETFSVSADYLLGLTHAPTKDVELQAVCDYTGLSPDAVSALGMMSKIADSEVLSAFVFSHVPRITSLLTDFKRLTEEQPQGGMEEIAEYLEKYELLSFRFAKYCEKIPESLFGIDSICENLSKKKWNILESFGKEVTE